MLIQNLVLNCWAVIVGGVAMWLGTPLATGDDVVVAVTSVKALNAHENDPGFKTRTIAGGAGTGSLSNAGDTISLPGFQIYAHEESKVNTQNDEDTTEYPIEAVVTLTQPIAAELKFTGTTVGQEDVDVVPDHVLNNPFALLAWASENPELAELALGRGFVRWSGPAFVDLGGGKKLKVSLADTHFSKALQLNGDGPDSAETVMVNFELVQEGRFSIVGMTYSDSEIAIRFMSNTGKMYRIQTSQTGRPDSWSAASAEINGTDGETTATITRPPLVRTMLIRVREL